MNKYGLARAIPEGIKREVRQRCGFGCVICGIAFVQYEHVDPEYKDAYRHEADKIALLCPSCHARVTSRQWSKARVKLAMRSPRCLQDGFTRDYFDFSDQFPALRFGGMLLRNCPTPIQVHGYPLFSIKPSEDPLMPFLFSGTFSDSEGEVSLRIVDNEWIVGADVWDLVVEGPRITIREALRKVHLVLRVDPPNELVVERLNMAVGDYRFEANSESLIIYQGTHGRYEFTNSIADNCQVGISLG